MKNRYVIMVVVMILSAVCGVQASSFTSSGERPRNKVFQRLQEDSRAVGTEADFRTDSRAIAAWRARQDRITGIQNKSGANSPNLGSGKHRLLPADFSSSGSAKSSKSDY